VEAAADEELEMLRLELHVARSDGERREERLAALERRVDDYLGAVGTMCSYLVAETERLRASS
jgi:hypothetical protein